MINGMAYVIHSKTYEFAVRIVKLSDKLDRKRKYTISRQILRSATSIGANVEESIGAVSDRDYLNKLGIAYKEARESAYWLKLLKDTGLITTSEFIELHDACLEINKILFAMIRTKKNHMKPK